MKITRLLTDNGSQFTDRFTNKKRRPSGNHKFDVCCKALGIEHRLCPPRHPQTRKAERFNGRISQMLEQTRFDSAAQLEATLMEWQQRKPELFKKRVYKQEGLDTLCDLRANVEVNGLRGFLRRSARPPGWGRGYQPPVSSPRIAA